MKTLKSAIKIVIGIIVFAGFISIVDGNKPVKAGVPKCWDKDIKKQLLDEIVERTCLFNIEKLAFFIGMNMAKSQKKY